MDFLKRLLILQINKTKEAKILKNFLAPILIPYILIKLKLSLKLNF